ncbi:hypothetical protein [Nocardia sp. NPDC004722]
MADLTCASCIVQVGEGFFQLLVAYALDVEVEPLVERLVEVASNGVVPLGVQLLWVGEEVQCLVEDTNADRQLRRNGRQGFLNAGALLLNFPEPGLDLFLREGIIERQIDQAIFLDVQLRQPSLQVAMHLLHARMFFVEYLIEQCANVRRKRRR